MQEESTAAEQHSCSCDEPRHEERVGYKGATRIYCARCDLPLTIRLSR